jgi:hypothetical protein
MIEKVNIDERYVPSEELNQAQLPYTALAQVLHSCFDFESLFDVGCRNGKLLHELNKIDSSTKIAGCDYFQWAIDASETEIKPFVYRWDLRDEMKEDKFDLVTCFEVAEHIDEGYCDVFLSNLKSLTNKYLILTWSSAGGKNHPEVDDRCQHLNPLCRDDVLETVSKYFTLEENLTNEFIRQSNTKQEFLWYWRDSLTVWSPL